MHATPTMDEGEEIGWPGPVRITLVGLSKGLVESQRIVAAFVSRPSVNPQQAIVRAKATVPNLGVQANQKRRELATDGCFGLRDTFWSNGRVVLFTRPS